MTGGRQKAEGRRQKWSVVSGVHLTIGYWLLAIAEVRMAAATNSPTNPDEIPPLRPPKPDIPPGFWEQHGLLVVLLGVAAVIVAVLLWRMLPRPRPAESPEPAAIARQALESLRHRPEDAALLAETSLILRRYFVAAFDLPRMEFTNSELCGQLEREAKADPELSKAATALLKGMEHLRFDAEPNTSVTQVVEQALELIHRTEVQLNPPLTQGDGTTLKA